MASWPEIETVIKENRRELVIKGNSEIRQRFKSCNGIIPEDFFNPYLINFLELASCGIKIIPPSINKLKSLTQILLNNNDIENLPDEITSIDTLKVLDVSYNQINSLPEDLGRLCNLQILNASSNQLKQLPASCSNLSDLLVLNISSNKFEEFPHSILCGGLSTHVTDVNMSHNMIEFIPDEFGNLNVLKQFDISDNKVEELPQTISNILKLKLANYKSNPLKDRRLKKLIDTNNSQKSIMDYIRSKGRKSATVKGKGTNANESGQKVTKRQQKKNTLEDENKIDIVKYTLQILKLDDESATTDLATNEDPKCRKLPQRVIATDAVKDVRPYIVACVTKNVDLSDTKFKLFLSIQTDLHDHMCGKRTLATIATHDATYIKDAEIYYDARPPSLISILPLGKNKVVSGTRLFRNLKKEAEEIRKQKKKNQPTGIHKYLNLLDDKDEFPFLYIKKEDKETAISLPPLTNGATSKISPETKDIFIEVTSSKSLQDCKNVMDALLRRMVESGILSTPDRDFYDDSSDDEESEKKAVDKMLFVQQVKIMDSTGKLKVLYPSKTDLIFDKEIGIKVMRPY